MRILVIGATGMLGEPVARRLHADGHQVRILARDEARARRRFDVSYEVCRGDVTQIATLLPAMRDCDAVHVSLRGGNTLEGYARIERDGAANVAAAAARSGIRRLGYVSAAGIGESPTADPLLRIKADAVAAVVASGVDYTLFKPTHFMESLPQFVQRSRATVIGHQPHHYHYVAASDFASLVSRAFTSEAAANQSLTILGPERFTMTEALTRYCAMIHPGMPVGSMPIVMARFIGMVTGNRDLRFAATLFTAFADFGERGDPGLADRLFGRAGTTLEQWCCARAASGGATDEAEAA